MTDSTPSTGVSRIGQISVNVHDLDRAVAFYRDRLGMRLILQAPGMAFFDCDGIRLMLAIPEGQEFDHPSSVIYYKVDDIRSSHAALAGRGVEFVSPPHRIARLPDHDLWMAFFRDSEGNTLSLMSEVRE